MKRLALRHCDGRLLWLVRRESRSFQIVFMPVDAKLRLGVKRRLFLESGSARVSTDRRVSKLRSTMRESDFQTTPNSISVCIWGVELKMSGVRDYRGLRSSSYSHAVTAVRLASDAKGPSRSQIRRYRKHNLKLPVVRHLRCRNIKPSISVWWYLGRQSPNPRVSRNYILSAQKIACQRDSAAKIKVNISSNRHCHSLLPLKILRVPACGTWSSFKCAKHLPPCAVPSRKMYPFIRISLWSLCLVSMWVGLTPPRPPPQKEDIKVTKKQLFDFVRNMLILHLKVSSP